MDPGKARWHLSVLSHHNNALYSSLLHEHHISCGNKMRVKFKGEDERGYEEELVLDGYYATKNKVKYFLSAQIHDPEKGKSMLPIKVGQDNQRLVSKENIVLYPKDPTPFRITPEVPRDVRDFVDSFVPFNNTNKLKFTVAKIIALASYFGRTNVCLATNPSFGKTSLYDSIHYLTDKCPVFKPRSVPGIMNRITSTGIMCFDESHRSAKETRDAMEDFCLQVGGGKTKYLNGASKSANTRSEYPTANQSITFLFNRMKDYQKPEKDYFEYMFSNNRALDDRFLKILLEGNVKEDFTVDFDVPGTAESNKMYYIKFAKWMLGMQGVYLRRSYERKYREELPTDLSERKLAVYNEITYLLDMYCKDESEYMTLTTVLKKGIQDYKDMVKNQNGDNTLVVKEEVI